MRLKEGYVLLGYMIIFMAFIENCLKDEKWIVGCFEYFHF